MEDLNLDIATTAKFLVPCFFALGASAFLSFLFIRFHGLHAIASRSDKRRHNERPVPLIGGAAIAGGFFAGSLALAAFGLNPVTHHRLIFVLGAVGVALLTGLLDDAYELRARWKLVGQCLVTLCLLVALRGLDTPPDRLLGQDTAASLALKWFWCMGILNSINLIDGLDELASGIAMIVLAFVTLAGQADAPFHNILLHAGFPALLGFYLWNRYPARIYLGESGAQMAGIFLFLGAMTYRNSPSAGVDTVSLFFALGVPILDTLLAIVRRSGRKTGMMTPDREHLHHRLGRLGLTHPNISRFLHALTVYLCAVAYAYGRLTEFSVPFLALALSGLGFSLFLLRLAERRLYYYLANFASHMLRVLDANGADPLTLVAHRRSLESAGASCAVVRLDLSYCVGNLMEKSPGRIQNFYDKLGQALRGEPRIREVHFENSRTAVVLQQVPAGRSVAWVEAALRADLAAFEEKEHIDLGLHLAGSLRPVAEPQSRPSAGAVA